MKEWMTLKDISDYLQLPERNIYLFIKRKQIPFHDNHGFLRFSKEEIDEWMRKPVEKQVADTDTHEDYFNYRGRPIKSYMLTASIVFLGKNPWERLPGFIKKTVQEVNSLKQRGIDRGFLRRNEFTHLARNFNDYVRISCHLGLIENRKGIGREKEYYPTEHAYRICNAEDPRQVKKIIQDSIIDIVTKRIETIPVERHSIFLLWYVLKIKERGDTPEDNYFQKGGDERSNYYPSIRRAFAVSLCDFLFDSNRSEEQKFLDRWKQLIQGDGIK
jgi:excisionase family DNA binding protein